MIPQEDTGPSKRSTWPARKAYGFSSGGLTWWFAQLQLEPATVLTQGGARARGGVTWFVGKGKICFRFHRPVDFGVINVNRPGRRRRCLLSAAAWFPGSGYAREHERWAS